MTSNSKESAGKVTDNSILPKPHGRVAVGHQKVKLNLLRNWRDSSSLTCNDPAASSIQVLMVKKLETKKLV